MVSKSTPFRSLPLALLLMCLAPSAAAQCRLFERTPADGGQKDSGLYIIAGSTELGAARETQSNGVFTRALLDGLDGAADAPPHGDGNGTIDVGELIQYAADVVKSAEGPQRVTTPRVEGGEPFPLARVPR